MGLFGKGVARICAVAAARTARQMAAQVRLALRETPTVELRLDWLGSDRERMRLLAWLSRNTRRGATFLATCRRRPGGGFFRGSISQELEWLARARIAGCAWCDLEVETLRAKGRKPGLRGVGLPRILLSAHDFRRTPVLRSLAATLKSRQADAIKIAAYARTIADSVRQLKFAHGTTNSVAVPMGEVGLPARVLALREGSALAYAPVEIATAPGQVSLHELKDLYRAHELTRRTQVFGVIGNPIGHSLSPLLHNTGFVVGQIDAVYLPFLVDDLRDFLKAVPDFGIKGFSVTIPHKQKILDHLDDCDALAADIGAVNTVEVRPDGSLYGSNTDCWGVLRPLQRKLRIRGSRILILGSGGTARTVAFALSREGAAVAICARREAAARRLARAIGGEALPRRALRTERFEAVFNTTPLGMHPHQQISPLNGSELHCRIVMDAIYRPERTELLKLAARKGIATISGVQMFLAQGIAQWELWMKRRAPEKVMRRAILGVLRHEARTSPSRRSA
jgi:3-dehydroquinate dehydratase/shikimate dehydrogenase